MRILFISNGLIGSGLCQRLVTEGNDVRLYIHEKEWKRSLDGIVPKTDDWRSELAWVGKEGLILFDDIFSGKEQDELRKMGYKVVGGSAGGDRLEVDRQYFQEVARESGIEILPFHNFSDVDEAIDFIKKNKGRWVVKQNTHLSYLNFIGKLEDGSDVIRVLEQYKRRGLHEIHLQKFAQGIEVGIARYFNGNDWIGPIEINHEHKMLHDGDTGPLTPEMGTVLWYTDVEVRLFTEILDKLKLHLKSIDFRGDIDINCIVTNDNAFPLEATPRFGNPSTEIQVALHKTPWSEFLNAVACGEQYTLAYKAEYGVAVSLVVPPFPYEPSQISAYTRDPLKIELSHHLSDDDLAHIHFEESSKIDNDYYWTGEYGAVLYTTGCAKTISEARKQAYDRMGKMHIHGMHYRKDIGVRVEQCDIPKLREWGWV